ncbi:MAG: PAS domain S-box protein [Betaproteobacteria bacterium]|nr:MAG: PAS domain S-box protein [Betaproteobacteria bacterium]
MKRVVPDWEMFRSPLARRLIVAIVLVSSTITLCLTVLQLYGEYRSALGGIQAVFRQIEEVHLKSMSESLWTTDTTGIQLQIEGIARVPNIEYIEVSDGGKIRAQAGHHASREIIERQYPMTYVYRGQTHDIGTLTVVAGLDGVYRGLVNLAFIILASNALKTFLVAGFAFAFFYWLVNRHLLYIAGYLRGLDLHGRAVPLILRRAAGRRSDELDEVATAINFMHENTRSMFTKLQDSEARLRLSIQASGIGLWDWDLATNDVYFSPEWKIQLGYRDEEIPNRFEEWKCRVHPEDLERVLAQAHAYLSSPPRGGFHVEFRLRHKDGSYRWFYAQADAIRDGAGKPVRMLGGHIDVTARKRAERDRAQLAAIVETSNDAILTRGLDRTILSWNAAAERLFGWSAQEAVGQTIDLIIPPERQGVLSRFIERMAAGEPLSPVETIHLRKDGARIPTQVTFSPVRDEEGKVIAYSFTVRDMTELKRKEEALRGSANRLRELAYRLRTVEEKERHAISRELHDRIGQDLSTLGLILGSLGAKLSQESLRAVATPLQDAQGLLKSVVANVRDVMAELRPPVLDDYGLLAALRQLVTEFARRTGIAAELSGVDLQPRLPPIVETAMFRISQEALNNIAKHAQAKHVEISLHEASGRVMLDIADDGIGIDASARPPDEKHWGLATMRERAEAVGIAFSLESAPGAGIRIALELERTAT